MNMRFVATATILTFNLFRSIQAGIVPIEDCNKCEVDTFDGEFALAIKNWDLIIKLQVFRLDL